MMQTADAAFRQSLAPASRRVAFILFLESLAAGFAAAIATSVAGFVGGWPLTVTVAAGLLTIAAMVVVLHLFAHARRHDLPFLATLIEKRSPGCRNLLITAAELHEKTPETHEAVRSLVFGRAERVASELHPTSLFPAKNALVALAVSAAIWIISVALLIWPPVVTGNMTGGAAVGAAITDINITVTPPSYSGQPAQQLRNPDRIVALEGSRIRVTAAGNASAINIETLAGGQAMAQENNSFSHELIADADGFIALLPSAGGVSGSRTLIGLSVNPDHPPVARITLPGRDLFISDPQRTIDLSLEASDDIGLASLRVRFTRVSGAGEQFTFTDGEIPVSITRTDGKRWNATGKWVLDSLKLAPGDMVVYRAVVTDARPGAVPSESDSFIVEITGPGALAAGGFSIDEEQDRYAISQQMVILKSERLLARRSSMPAAEYSRESQEIGAEQRKVRAEFVFMMGGELGEDIAAELTGVGNLDEHTHAAVDDDAISGRLATNGRLDLIRALRSMSRASSALNAVDVTQALVDEKEALVYLQRAFARTRYILRTLTERERLDQARRMTGILTGAGPDRRPVPEANVDSAATKLRAVLSQVAGIAASLPSGSSATQQVSALAQQVLQVDPASDPVQRIAMLLSSAGKSLASGQRADALRMLDSSAIALTALVRTTAGAAPRNNNSSLAGSVNGALIDALRRGSGGRR